MARGRPPDEALVTSQNRIAICRSNGLLGCSSCPDCSRPKALLVSAGMVRRVSTRSLAQSWVSRHNVLHASDGSRCPSRRFRLGLVSELRFDQLWPKRARPRGVAAILSQGDQGMKRPFLWLLVVVCVGFLPLSACGPAPTPTPTPTPTPRPYGPKMFAADPVQGFHWPYFLYAPSSVQSKHIFVVPNNTGRDNDFSVHESRTKGIVDSMKSWADTLGMALLVPVFPRFDDETDGTIASQYLGRGTLEESWQLKYPKLARQDLQLLAMVDHARGQLASVGIQTDGKLLLWGYSASGMFVSRFAILHPEAVSAAAFGGHGWATAPVVEWRGLYLPYPYGVGDLEQLTGRPFDLETFRHVQIYSFMGAEDSNRWGLPGYIGYHDRASFHESFKVAFGFDPPSLSASAEQIYFQMGCSATFVLHQGADHQDTSEMYRDSLKFLSAHKD